MVETYSTSATGDAFEELVKGYYEHLGYVVKRNVPIAGKQIDLVATLRLPDGQSHTVLIECKYHDSKSAGNDDIHDIAGAYTIAKANHLAQACTVVTNTSFSLRAQEAAMLGGIHLLTQEQLAGLAYKVPLPFALPWQRAYEAALVGLPHFVPGRAHTVSANAQIPDLASFLYSQATSTTDTMTLLLGGTGTGKTTQLLTLAERLTREYLSGAAVPVGIYVPLERFTKHREGHQYFDEFVIGYVRSLFRMPDLSWSEIMGWCANRTAVLLLDGFDEIRHLGSETDIQGEFEHIVRTLGGASAIISCRTTLAARTTSRLPDLMVHQLMECGRPRPVIAEVDLFSYEDVISYVNAVGAPKRLLKGGIANTVLRRPVLLHTVTSALEGAMPGRKQMESAPALLDYCIMTLLTRRPALRRAGIGMSEWRTFLEECALRMMLDEIRHIGPERLATMVAEYFVTVPDMERLSRLEFDASVRTVLDFDLKYAGLRWGHAIFRDFLAASALARRLVVPQPKDSEFDGRLLTPEQLEFVQYAVQVRARDWKSLTEFRRPRVPSPIAPGNPWLWISPGLSIVIDLPAAGGRLAFFPRGYWITEQPVRIADLKTIGMEWASGDRTRYNSQRLAPAAPVTYLTYEEATQLATTIGGRLPTDNEWERAARWIDGTYPRPEVLPSADTRRASPPTATNTPANPWGVRNIVGCIWQWTSTYDVGAQRFICRGPWWGASHEDKLHPTLRLTPREPDHVRTGVRVVRDVANGGDL